MITKFRNLLCVSDLRGKSEFTGLVYAWSCFLSVLFFNPLHPSISMHILHSVLYTFPQLLFYNQEPLYLVCFCFILVNLTFDSGVIL